MGMSNIRKYNLQEDIDIKVSIINLTEDDDGNENTTTTEQDKKGIKLPKNNKIETTEKQQIPPCQRNLQTFYNS